MVAMFVSVLLAVVAVFWWRRSTVQKKIQAALR